MMKTIYKLSLLFALGIFFGQEKCLLDIEKPKQDLVQDFANILPDDKEQMLRESLTAYNDSTSTQILILTTTNLCGYDKAEFTYTLAEKWRVGQKGKDNGVVIMVKPKEIDGKGEVFIATGYGTEGALPDALAKRIVENEMIPSFKANDYFSGIAKASQTVMYVLSGEFTADKYNKKAEIENLAPVFLVVFFLLIYLIFQVVRTKNYAQRNHLGFWAAWALLNATSSRHPGSWGNFSSGRGSFGGGGGFGGFGGGGFGGGGAGGSW